VRIRRIADGSRALVLSQRDRDALGRAEAILMQAIGLLEDRFEELGSSAPALDRYDWAEALSDAKVNLGGVPDTIKWPEPEDVEE